MTDQELKDLVASLALDNKEIKQQQQQSSRELQQQLKERQKEADRRQKEADKRQNETDKQLKEADLRLSKKLDKVSKLLGNIGQNNGDVAEEFFYQSLVKHLQLGEIKFDDITRHMFKHKGTVQEEYDLILTNGSVTAVIEVKYKAHVEDIPKLKRKLSNFRKLFPVYDHHKLYGVLASLHINKNLKQAILQEGYFALQRSGEQIICSADEHLMAV